MAESYRFNLWTEPWIPVNPLPGTHAPGAQQAEEHPSPIHQRLSPHYIGIEEALQNAHLIANLAESSPLALAALHRLLTAIAQDMVQPQTARDLLRLHAAGRFDPAAIHRFGEAYAHRFDLFDADAPFLQSGDIPLARPRDAKSVAYLAYEVPSGTGITHFRHGDEDAQRFCPICAAHGLIGIPHFATTGGAGIKPSINGVPPLYVLPQGRSLFASLCASLVTPPFQPGARSKEADLVWWRREARVPRSALAESVSYLHSLTFAARRVRLHPGRASGPCTRCGAWGELAVEAITFEMGESRPKELAEAQATWWQDPFAAYGVRAAKPPVPIRPAEGKALWREYHALFLTGAATKDRTLTRPRLLDQLAQLREEGGFDEPIRFRCIGLRTDMKAKIFEWVDASFHVPPAALQDERAGVFVGRALQFADECIRAGQRVFRGLFAEKHKPLLARYQDTFWGALAEPFRQLVLALGEPDSQEAAATAWRNTTQREAARAFVELMEQVGDDAANLRRRIEGEIRLRSALAKIRATHEPGAEARPAKSASKSRR